MSTSDARALRAMEGHIVTVELRGGRRLDDCELVSSGRAGVQTLWLLVDGEDVLVPTREILTLAGAGTQGSA